ncbi:MAG: S9 family peptidase, partial [Bacteroidota bacterium]
MRQLLTLLLFTLLGTCGLAQNNLGYQQPDKAILDLVDVPLAPRVLMDDAKEHMILLYRDAYKSIDELSQVEMRLGGLRIDPKTNIGSRTTYYNKVAVRGVMADRELKEVTGLPAKPKLANVSWSPDQKMAAMTHTTPDGVEVWVLDVASGKARRLTDATETPINANLGDVINWFKDSKSMLVKLLPESREPLIDGKTAVPTGPTISTADGKKAQNRTYQDLLKNPNDEHNFAQLAQSRIARVSLDGKVTDWLPTGMYRGISFSPDGKYVMVTRLERPFSYLVPYYRFPAITHIYDTDAKPVSTVNTVPLIEDLPKGFMATRPGRRNVGWRADRPSTLTYVEALDGGDPAKEVAYRDRVFELTAPFKGEGEPLLQTINRYAGIMWGDDNTA